MKNIKSIMSGTLMYLCAFYVVLFQQEATAADSSSTSPVAFELVEISSGYTLPHFLVSPPGDSRRFVLDLVGRIYILGSDGKRLEKPFLDLSASMVGLQQHFDERGLLGLAFHPDFEKNSLFYVYYSAPLRHGAPQGWNHTSHLSEFRVDKDNPNQASPASERVVMQIDQPQFNHNGGRLAFGPDGYLYVGLGDGGGAADLGLGHPPLGHGQDVTTLLGSVLRIDVNEKPYGIPQDNPFVAHELPKNKPFSGDAAKSEIWAWGIRNIWGMSFDPVSGHLFGADVGQDLWEEVNILRPGNFGWNIKEGYHWFDSENVQNIVSRGPNSGSLGQRLIDPLLAYPNSRGHQDGVGVSIIGGQIYRGKALKGLQGHYVFGDWSATRSPAAGLIMVATPENPSSPWPEQRWSYQVVKELDQFVLGFGSDNDGELYVLTNQNTGPTGTTGRIWALRPKSN